MGSWTRVKWTEAGQVTAQLDWRERADDPATPPQAFFEGLRAAGRLEDAAMFLALALPRYEAVMWAARMVRDAAPQPASRDEADALKAALLWVQDPTESRRRAAEVAAGRLSASSPQQFCALAAFYSGGSMAPENCAPVPPPKHVCGRFAAGAVLSAAAASADRKAAIRQALDAGEAIARGAGAISA